MMIRTAIHSDTYFDTFPHEVRLDLSIFAKATTYCNHMQSIIEYYMQFVILIGRVWPIILFYRVAIAINYNKPQKQLSQANNLIQK